MKVAVLGATGATGRLVVDRLRARGHQPVAVARSRLSGDVATVTGDLTDAGFLETALAGCDAVISCLGQRRKSASLFAARVSPPDILQRVARATLSAIGSRPMPYVYLSAFGVGSDLPKHSIVFRIVLRLTSLKDAYADHAEAERLIRASNARWTIVRPPGLTDADTEVELIDKGDGWSSFDTASKRSVAAFLVRCVEAPTFTGRTVTIGEPPRP